MVKTNLNTTKGTKFILFSSLAAVLVLFFTPLFFIDNLSKGIVTIWGFQAILGIGSVTVGTTSFALGFMWYLFIGALLFLVMGFTTYYIGPKSKGYYIFNAIVFVILAVICYNSINWFAASALKMAANSNKLISLTHLGIGPWFAGLVCVVNTIVSIVEYKTYKLR